MGAKEIDWQTKIIQCVRNQGGYGGKWSSSVQVGKPDLILRLPLLNETFLMEVKLFKDIAATGKFDRHIETTEKQREQLGLYEKAGGLSCVGVVLYYKPTHVVLVALPWTTERLSSLLMDGPVAQGKWVPGVGFNMEAIMRQFKERLRG